jgi:hypothetical protein
MEARYRAHADFVTVYIEEAHAADAWALPHATGGTPEVRQPRSTEERCEVARCFAARFASRGLGTVLVDTLAGEAAEAYAAWPERLFVVVDGVVAYKGGPGPFGYVLPDVEAWLAARYGPAKA